jgi:Holliday junction DNA helicase RuvA
MIVKLKGFVDYWCDDFVDLDVNGVVFRVFMPQKKIDGIIDKDSKVILYIFEILKENERLFFGFLNSEDRELFSELLTVQGVGGKMALNIMSQLTFEDINESIISKSSEIFSSISGVGNKLALRIINELYEKIKKKSDSKRIINSGTTNLNYNDLVSCLFNLGYPQNVSEKTALEVIRKNKNSTLEKLIPIALNHLSQPNK